MIKTIMLGEKEIKLKSSAATNILYKRLFKEDILLILTEYSKNLKEIQKMQARMSELRKDETKSQEELIDESNAILNSDVFKKASNFQSDTLPKLAFIMWLEANEPVEKLFGKLTEEQYLFWLMTIDQDELLEITGQVMDIWQAGTKTHSKPKN